MFYAFTRYKKSNLRLILFWVSRGGYFFLERLYCLFIGCFTSLRLFALVRL